ncbi:copper chaperone [Coemansia javaensis]|uniref:Superoxide dismutase 1 copper chaperone n=1 Tax=Coemansia javaensis TaxID=2761396 RepID=A0A9W8HDG3_9FUNG|nr:copper chaperone [Coemansia javaensis]
MALRVQLAVDMVCQSCVEDVGRVLDGVAGVARHEISLAEQQVVVEGTARPSALLEALKASGRAAVVRGAGSSAGGNIGAAVCILEEAASGTGGGGGGGPRGLARLVQISDSLCFVDITVADVPDGARRAAIHACGDLSDVPASCGALWSRAAAADGDNAGDNAGDLGSLVVEAGRGGLVLETDRFRVWEVIGRSLVVDGGGSGADSGVLAGVIARSAGLFENDKRVCACSGNTLWQEERLVGQSRRL